MHSTSDHYQNQQIYSSYDFLHSLLSLPGYLLSWFASSWHIAAGLWHVNTASLISVSWWQGRRGRGFGQKVHCYDGMVSGQRSAHELRERSEGTTATLTLKSDEQDKIIKSVVSLWHERELIHKILWWVRIKLYSDSLVQHRRTQHP